MSQTNSKQMSVKRWALTFALLMSPVAFGQMSAPLSRSAWSNPADPDAWAPPLQFVSAFNAYRVYEDDGAGNWRRVNDLVRDAAAAGNHAGPIHAPRASPPSAPMPQHGVHK